MCDTFAPAEMRSPKINAGKTVADAPWRPVAPSNSRVHVFSSVEAEAAHRFIAKGAEIFARSRIHCIRSREQWARDEVARRH